MRYYIIAGEASGDLHGSNLIKELKKIDADADFRCWGGDKMQGQGANVVKHYRDLAFMGFVEVVANLPTILSNIRFCKSDIAAYKPDAVVLIDYPGFNLRIADFVKKQGIKVFYYISPQVWAWKQSRVHKIKKVVDEMYCILPFEKSFYQKFDYEVQFVGHPLLDAIEEFANNKPTFEVFVKKNELAEKPIIALLPGSRKQEIKTMLPIMAAMENKFLDYQFIVAAAPSQNNSFYSSLLSNTKIKVLHGNTYQLLQQAHAALVTSGTATLETALFNVPEIVCYKGSAISYRIARSLVKVDYISLVNLILEKEVVKELIQHELTEKNLQSELTFILKGEKRDEMFQCYKQLRNNLGGTGASATTANLMLKSLQE